MQNLWNQFKVAFVEEIESVSDEILLESWQSNPKRTSFYFELILPKIATKLGLLFKKEKPLRADGIFYQTGSQKTEIPIVVIESENDILSSSDEIGKLCFISAPLKILFVVFEWTEQTSEKIASENWEYIIADFAEAGQLVGTTAIIIAEWTETLKFYSRVYDNVGQHIEKDSLILKL